MSDAPTVYTIGHSTHTADAFLELLQAHGIRQLADVRLIPKSSRHPHFASEPLAHTLAVHGIDYRHFPGLGGRRRPRPDSVNTAWRVEAFRGYADFMGTEAFKQALAALMGFASRAPTALMCAEAVWWQCHRRLLADALVVRGLPVRHILSAGDAKPHELSEFARIDGDEVTYPGLL
ncbi:MAG TPA: DUF488 domain-containing protein [Vicinamibacterales bacterium]|nr:DUF488 domain-containing protein [Vicinamibacterales bacterium]